jgi:uncharacterized lipoprotein YmbA
MRTIVFILAACTLAACASKAPDVQYYTIDMTPAAKSSVSGVSLDVDRLRAAESLRRKNILIKKSATEIEYYADAEWAASVEEMVAEKLESEFGPDLPGRPAYIVSGTIHAFEQLESGSTAEARIKIDLALYPVDAGASDPPLLERTHEIQLPADSPAPSDVVQALSRGLEEIAAAVAEDANRMSAADSR